MNGFHRFGLLAPVAAISLSSCGVNSVPTAEMEQYCRAAPDEPFIGGETTPPGTVYSWFCDGETPTIRGQDSYPDAQGYDPNDWKTVSP